MKHLARTQELIGAPITNGANQMDKEKVAPLPGIIQELLGHKSYLMTLRYAHLSGDYKKEVVDKFGQRMDTVWTSSPISIDEANMLKSLRVNQDNVLAILSRDGVNRSPGDAKSYLEFFLASTADAKAVTNLCLIKKLI